jgi:NTE family protein
MRLFCLFFCVLISCCWSQQSRPKIGVALQGGGAKGLAHIGVLKWFEDHHIPIDYIAGTSMGGLIGGLYATGHTPAEIEQIVEQTDWGAVMSGETPYQSLSFRRKEDLRAFPNGLELGLREGVQPPGGLNSGQAVRFIIDRYVLPYSSEKNFDKLPIPFRCVATDLISGKSVVFSQGSLTDALRATMSIPGVFSPVKEGNKIYADGGLLNNLPTDVARQMGADIVVGVHLTTGPIAPANVRSLFQVAGTSSDVMIDANELRGMEQADILLTVNLEGFTTLDFSRAPQIMPKGIQAAQQKEQVLSKLRVSDEDWTRYLAERNSRVIRSVPVPAFIEVAGTSPALAADIQDKFSSFADKPIDSEHLEKQLTEIVGLGRFNSVNYSLTNRDGQTGLLLNTEEKDYSPPWVKPGFIVNGGEPNDVQFGFGSRFTFLDIGGYRSEVRLDFSIGSTYSAAAEYYHPISPTSRWFVAPRISMRRDPLNLYFENNFLAEYKLNQFDGGFDFGYSFNRFNEIRLGYDAGYLRATRWIGSPILPNVSGRTGVTRLRYAMDRLDNPVIPRRGTALLLSGGWVDGNPGAAEQFPSAEATFEAFHPVSPPASVYMIAAGGSTFGSQQTGFPQFTLGGPARLAAYGINEFLTNQYFYFRFGYLHRLIQMPSVLGSGLYFDGHFEFAKPYAPATVSGLPGDVTAGIVMQTLLGPVLIGGSVGESGHSKWFFQLGRVF